jgi:hypothetical protein
MLPYTVLLRTPDMLAHDFPYDSYLAHTEAYNVRHAIANARDMAMDAYGAWDDGIDPSGFAVVFVCHGHQHNMTPE